MIFKIKKIKSNPNKVYNRIIDFLGFMATLSFCVLKIIKVLTVSWWWVVLLIFLPGLFHASEEED